jgi:hypothetical protein
VATIDDQATEREEQARDIALRQRRPEGPQACGQCYNCGEVVSGDRRWCDSECRMDWEMRNDR